MVSRVNIKNFKSIRDLEFEAKRVNLFIGEPNTGKSNLLDALALLSEGVHDPRVFKDFFRVRSVADLFWDQQVADTIQVVTDRCECFIKFKASRFGLHFPKPELAGKAYEVDPSGTTNQWVNLTYGVRAYRYKALVTFANQELGVLASPFGDNLASIVYTNKTLRQRISDLFKTRGFRLEIRPVQMELMQTKTVDDELYSFPYESISETWRHIVFYMAILETNQNATLLLDEPEANTFPFYTKYLAERIALDTTNQFFITTHNPILLSNIVAKAAMNETAVFVSYMDRFETRLRPITGQRLSAILDYGSSIFFNLERLLSE